MRTVLLITALCASASAQDLKVYAIDVEGGKATLYVSPSGRSMLVDAGYAGHNGRDAARIAAAAADAGVKQIDYLVITHYHQDHVGGVPELAARIPILNFVDHGPNFETVKDVGGFFDAYVATRSRGNHIVVKAGDHIPIDGMQVDVVTASGLAITRSLPGAGGRNQWCADYRAIAEDKGENSRSIGLVVTLGKFRLSDLGDLYWNQEADLACPNNLIGSVDVYMTTHHAKRTSGAPALVYALRPQAAIMNNGPTTGAAEDHWETIRQSPGRPDIWQLHYAANNDGHHNAPKGFIANFGEQDHRGNWILLTAHPDGSFAIRNSLNGKEKRYAPRP